MVTRMSTDQPAYLTKQEAAQMARVGIRTIENAIRAGELKSVGGTGLVRIRPEWVDDWLERRGNHAAL
jgi:excisionase family DNA binding protein